MPHEVEPESAAVRTKERRQRRREIGAQRRRGREQRRILPSNLRTGVAPSDENVCNVGVCNAHRLSRAGLRFAQEQNDATERNVRVAALVDDIRDAEVRELTDAQPAVKADEKRDSRAKIADNRPQDRCRERQVQRHRGVRLRWLETQPSLQGPPGQRQRATGLRQPQQNRSQRLLDRATPRRAVAIANPDP